MVRREFRKEENRKHVHSSPLLPIRVETTLEHTVTPPSPSMAVTIQGDTGKALALPGGLRSRSGSVNPSARLFEPQDPQLQRRHKS